MLVVHRVAGWSAEGEYTTPKTELVNKSAMANSDGSLRNLPSLTPAKLSPRRWPCGHLGSKGIYGRCSSESLSAASS